MKGILAPFLKVESKKSWSLLSIFGVQSWTDEERNAEIAHYEEVVAEEKREQYAKQIRRLYQSFMKEMLVFAENRLSWSLAEWMEHIQTHEILSLDERYLYDFLLLCHQRSPLSKGAETEDELSMHLLVDATMLLEKRQLVIVEQHDTLQVTPRFKIQNLLFMWQEE
jgi:hypothetical protein